MKPDVDIQAQLPLSEATFFVLLSLSPGARHGYAILKETEDLSEGRVVLSTGTLYGALARLLDLGWITRVSDREPEQTGRPRKAYALTDLGRRILSAEVQRLRSLVKAARTHAAGERA